MGGDFNIRPSSGIYKSLSNHVNCDEADAIVD